MPETTAPDKKISSRSIASSLFFAFLIVSVGVLLLENIINMSFSFQQQQQTIFREQQAVAQSAATVVREFVTDRLRTLNDTAIVGNLSNLSKTEQQVVLNRLLKTNTSFRQIAIFDNKRKLVINASQLSFVAFDEFSKHINATLFTHIQEKDQTHVTNVYIDKETNEPIVTMAVPIKDAFGDFKGALVAEVNLKFMWDLVANLQVGKDGTAYVVDQDGYLLASADTSKVLKRENLRNLKEVSNFAHNTQSAEQVSEITRGINATTVVSTYAKVADEPSWAVIVELPITEAYGSLIRQFFISFTIILISILIVIFSSRFFARRITKPIINLRDAVNQISTGNWDIPITVTSQDEIGELATAFKKMTQQLKESYGSMEQKVKDKTAELAQRMTETERINKMMIGRELKMIELKKELDQLKQNSQTTKNVVSPILEKKEGEEVKQ